MLASALAASRIAKCVLLKSIVIWPQVNAWSCSICLGWKWSLLIMQLICSFSDPTSNIHRLYFSKRLHPKHPFFPLTAVMLLRSLHGPAAAASPTRFIKRTDLSMLTLPLLRMKSTIYSVIRRMCVSCVAGICCLERTLHLGKLALDYERLYQKLHSHPAHKRVPQIYEHPIRKKTIAKSGK